jgi:XTP/dITP diphosphohydrolase
MLTLADDSGLEVDALGGEPGVHSARYAGPDATDSDRIRLLLSNLAHTPEPSRTARFRCVIAISAPGRQMQLYSGVCCGRIVREPRGDNGFGYDPVFLFPDIGLTMAQLTTEQKNIISHRAAAVREVVAVLTNTRERCG